ncbi:MATE family efflux transporter [Marinomonas primoryensis]|uniref:Multidrug-efflux transporter n=1 Tax=Marinomonas primoryensis TaxID=178399 RepID=A0A859CZ38_9GAMM|nr:MATE family efflux transporter [Marinomonas primoryensis]QKK81943.1 MATE_like (multidrug and toxic compound extrusion family and similar proteins) superfamily protein [Marinomonas primoryensis]
MVKRFTVLKEILHLLFPMVLTMTLELSISVVDTIMLGHYSALHLAAVGLASSLWLPVGCFLIGVTFGITPLVTRHLHGRQPKLVNLYMSQAIGLSVVLGLLASLIVAFVLPHFARFMATEEETRLVSVSYLYIFAPALPMLALMTAYKNLFEAAGRPGFPLFVASTGLALNVLFNYVLIFGKFGFPEMGAEGAALASSLSLYLAVSMFFVYDRYINKAPLFTRLVWRYTRKFSILLGVGAPAGFAFAFEVGLFSSMTWLISSFGDLALGGGQIVMSYTSFLFTPMMAMSAVTAIVVAKAMSKEGVEGVRKRIRVIILIGLSYVSMCFIITQLFHNQIPYIYSSNEQVVALAASILLISSCYQLPDMLQTVFTGALRGFRDTRSSMIAFGVSLFGLSIPFGFWLSHYSPWSETLSLRGFYIGLGAGLSLLAVILVVRFQVVLRRYEGKRIASPREVA